MPYKKKVVRPYISLRTSGGEGELPSVGSISDELGNLLNKIQEANAIAKNSEVNFEFGFQTSDQLFVKVIRGKKYKAYWEQPYFLEMLEILINEGTDLIIKTGHS